MGQEVADESREGWVFGGEGDAVAERETPVEGAAPADEASVDGAPADGASVEEASVDEARADGASELVQDESEVVAEVETSAEDVAPADTSSVTEEAEA